jgi:hypothetical protein
MTMANKEQKLTLMINKEFKKKSVTNKYPQLFCGW